jgi:hypothetical protein
MTLNITGWTKLAEEYNKKGDKTPAINSLIEAVWKLKASNDELRALSTKQAIEIETLQAKMKSVNNRFPSTALHEDGLCSCGNIREEHRHYCDECEYA